MRALIELMGNTRTARVLTVLDRLRQWHVVAVATAGGAAIVGGVFDPGEGYGWLRLLVGGALVGFAALDLHDRRRNLHSGRPFESVEGPLLWTMIAWLVTRMAGDHSGHLSLLPGATIATLVALNPLRIYMFPLLAGAAVELGLTAAGRQSGTALLLHILVYGGATVVLTRLLDRRAAAGPVTRSKPPAVGNTESRERARDFGLLTDQAPGLKEIPRLDQFEGTPTVGVDRLDYVEVSIELQLQMLRQGLGLTTAALLWANETRTELRLRGISSQASHGLRRGPFPMGAGIIGGVLRDIQELAVAPVKAGYSRLPYYDDDVAVGALLVVALPDPTAKASDEGRPAPEPPGVLCLDRQGTAEWTEAERSVVRLASRRIAIDVATSRRFKATDRELRTIRRFCAGLHELNGVLGLEAVAGAAIATVKTLVRVDLVAISTVNQEADREVHRVVRAEGLSAERLRDLHFTEDEGLVGQAVKVNHVLPAGGTHRSGRPIFTATDHLKDIRSLLIIPLSKKPEAPLGALTVASRTDDVFTAPRRELLALIATQLAIKIDLAQAHDQIQELATTDGLTGLANHRVFQQALANMLDRARRRQNELCLLLTDIDHFKRVNDSYGHPFGDHVLKAVAKVIDNAVRKVDIAARYGGEEFAIVLEDSGGGGGRQLAERIRQEVERLEFQYEGQTVGVTLSLGVSVYPQDGSDKTELIDHADRALYHAKHSGRNRVVTWSEVPSDEPGDRPADAERDEKTQAS